jgi:hypothetical protein
MAASLTLPISGLAPTSVSHELSACGEGVIYQWDILLDEVRRAEFFRNCGKDARMVVHCARRGCGSKEELNAQGSCCE